MRVLVYDDEERFMPRLTDSLQKLPLDELGFEVDVVSDPEFEDILEALKARQRDFRSRGEWKTGTTPLDDADVFVIEWDLFELRQFLKADVVAYMARCFSACKLIVGVNQHPGQDFDLTLTGDLQSFTDVDVTFEQIGNPNLWGAGQEDFWPWYWPVVADYVKGFGQRVADVRESLATKPEPPIWKVIGFPEEQFSLLPRSMAEFLGGDPDPTTVTFRNFVTKSGNGLELKESHKATDDEILARVGAARIARWLEASVLPGQDILVDAPHLASRFPSLIDGDVHDKDVWNALPRPRSYDQLHLDKDAIHSYRLSPAHWLSRPAWFWNPLREDENIREVREPWERFQPDWVFCEDASRFYEREACTKFLADVDSPFTQRFVRRFDGIGYEPRNRLLR